MQAMVPTHHTCGRYSPCDDRFSHRLVVVRCSLKGADKLSILSNNALLVPSTRNAPGCLLIPTSCPPSSGLSPGLRAGALRSIDHTLDAYRDRGPRAFQKSTKIKPTRAHSRDCEDPLAMSSTSMPSSTGARLNGSSLLERRPDLALITHRVSSSPSPPTLTGLLAGLEAQPLAESCAHTRPGATLPRSLPFLTTHRSITSSLSFPPPLVSSAFPLHPFPSVPRPCVVALRPARSSGKPDDLSMR